MSKKKEDELRQVKAKWWAAVKKTDEINTRVMGGYVRRIEKIPTWPFETKRLLELAGYVVVPLVVWLISYLTR
jgi:hypothetical protein